MCPYLRVIFLDSLNNWAYAWVATKWASYKKAAFIYMIFSAGSTVDLNVPLLQYKVITTQNNDLR